MKNFKIICYVIILGLVLTAPLLIKSPYYLGLLINIAIFSFVTLGLYVVALTGQMSMGHAAFVGIGAYFSALLSMRLGVNFWLCLPLAGLAAALFSIPIGYVTLRIKGIYFSIVTLGLGELVRLALLHWEDMTGGQTGIYGIPKPNAIPFPGFSIDFGNYSHFYYLIIFILAIGLLIAWRIKNSRVGVLFSSIALSDSLSETLGINIMNYKVLAFAIGCFFAGVGGSFYAAYVNFLTPNDFAFSQSVSYLIYLIVGGPASIFGAIFGAAFMIAVGDALKSFREIVPLVNAAILIAVMLWLPGGLVALPARVQSLYRRMFKYKLQDAK